MDDLALINEKLGQVGDQVGIALALTIDNDDGVPDRLKLRKIQNALHAAVNDLVIAKRAVTRFKEERNDEASDSRHADR